ncbi:MAG: glycosyltransferase family 4 protein [Rhodocyclaceae bacterium]|nr:glycosyltransferase family 4 protein [Rhodocyclaceae bacterium]
MKILHTEASRGWGGQEIRILEESKGMMERGHEVEILCPAEARLHEEAKRRGIPVTALPIGRKNLRGFIALRRWLKAHPVDVVNTHSSTDSWLAALACKTLRNPPPIVRTRHISAPTPKNAASRWLYSGAVRHVVTTGEALRRQLIEQNGVPAERITSAPTGIDPARFAPGDKIAARTALGLDPAGHYIGIVATLRSWKGHAHLLEAFAQARLPGWTLLIVGDGPMRGPIEAKVAGLGVDDRVRLVGQQDRPEDWMRALDIFVLPSYANEGVPQAVLQAMFTGLPIVTTPVGAILEAVSDGETALVVEPRNPQALAAALARLAGDAELGARLGVAARIVAEARFSREAMLERMEAIFMEAART